MIEIRQTRAYIRWFDKIRDPQARARILTRIRRLSLGNPGDVRPVGGGVSEMRIDYGPGLPRLLRKARRHNGGPARRWPQEHSGSGHQEGPEAGTESIAGT